MSESGGVPAGTTASLAEWVVEQMRSGVPRDVRAQAALVLTDVLACAHAGARLAGGKTVAAVLERASGTPEATSLSSGRRVPATTAAFVNATLGNVADLDDNLMYHVHIASTVVAAALAAGEAEDTSTASTIDAIAIGFDVAARLALAHDGVGRVVSGPPNLAVEWPRVFGHSGNVIGAACAAGCARGLGRDQMLDAMGIAGYSAPVPSIAKYTTVAKPPLNRYAAYGWMAWSGVLASELAIEGLTADRSVLDGPRGFWAMCGSQRVRADQLLEGLGARWWICETSLKREPACTWSRPAIAALAKLREEHAVDPDRVTEVVVHTHALSDNAMFHNTRPRDYVEAQLSFPFAVAAGLAGVPERDWYEQATIAAPGLQRLMRLVRVVRDEAATAAVYEQIRDGAEPGRVRTLPTTVEVRVGARTLCARSENGHGDPDGDYRFGADELCEKFVQHAEPRLGLARATAAAAALTAAATSDVPVRDLVALAAPVRAASGACFAEPRRV